MKMAGQPSVLAQMLKMRWKTPEAAMKVLFPEANETERKEIMRNLNYDEIGPHNNWLGRGARDQEPGDPPDAGVTSNGRFGEPGGFGPQSGNTNIEEDEMDPELEELLDALAERLPGAEDRLIRHVHDRRRRRAASDRRRAYDRRGDGRVRDKDQGTNTNPDPLPRVPSVNDRRGAHDAAPRGDGFYDRFPEVRRINIQG